MSFSQLPDELIFMICEKLVKVRDLVALSSSSKRLNFICKDVNYYDKNVYDIKRSEKSLELASNFNKSIKIKFNSSKNNTISYFPNIWNIHTLNLSCCKLLSDVSKLGKVHTLNLSYCDGVTDVSKLVNVHILNLSGCENITDVSMLGKVKHLNLSDCFI
jgi:hypothetical protein